MSEPLRFDYGPRFGNLLIYAAFMALLSVLSAVAAFLDGETQTRYGFVMSERQSTAFFAVTTVLFAGGAGWIITQTEPESVRKDTLTLGPEGLDLDRSGINPQTASVRYDSIRDLRHFQRRRQQILQIEYADGVLRLDPLHFNDHATFLSFKTALEERIALA